MSKIILDSSKYILLQNIAQEHGLEMDELLESYQAMLDSNLEQDLRDLAKELEMEHDYE